MIIFLVILVAIICFCTGIIVGLFINTFELPIEREEKEKRQTELSYERELKNFFDYDGTSQDI